jgi:multisubunit Na+/H+ antiporter MnhE subunit
MDVNFVYAILTGLSIGVLGGLVFFVWDMINHSFLIAHAISSAIHAFIVFGVLGFILGLLIGNLK